ncbi:DUF3320 domain-containing protein [Caulobacter sp. S45]|uniref:DUF3320 domain-containing protein n=1 Tax=Caulobacter sp. S45 TaxID=1641861 RepID=UPI001C2D48D0|nr:DUF3320 domain-containing protein [Caulobacter sp. S45]
MDDSRTSVFQTDLPVGAKLERARTELLDLGARNRLLNIPRASKSAKLLEVVDERSAEVFRILVREHKAFTFLPGRAAALGVGGDGAEEDEVAELAQPEDDEVDARGVARRHADTRLQTRLTPPSLQKRLLELYYDARALEEEQGANVLFLALGTLKWIDPNNAANIRYAPLILVPVSLERGNAAEKFKLRARLEDVAANLSLETYLERIHGLRAPHLEVTEEFEPAFYFSTFAEAVAAKPGWAVNPDDIVLGFFSFAKFLMYRDLDPDCWPAGSKLDQHALVRPLVADGFEEGEPLLPDDAVVDDHITPADMVHIVDSDSSQTMAIHEVRRGRNLVIQGPPGTGKSQTIANVIATAVADGKTVLFVAEKLAALEVVKRRLDSAGVGDACLELHSNKANKRAVLEDLRRTWELGAPRGDELSPLVARLLEARDQLNAHARRLHQPLGEAGYSPYHVIGHLTRLKQAGQKPTDIRLEGATAWTADEFSGRVALLAELVDRVVDIGVPLRHAWRGIGLQQTLPPDVDRLIARIVALYDRLQAIGEEDAAIAAVLEAPAPATLEDATQLLSLAARLADAPNLEPEALGATVWREDGEALSTALGHGETHAALQARLNGVLAPSAWSVDLQVAREGFAELPSETPAAMFDDARALVEAIPRLAAEVRVLSTAIGREHAPEDLRGATELARIAQRVSAAPDADPAAFVAELWTSGVERADDLAEAVRTFEAARAEIGSELTEAAWSLDVAGARGTLAAHGTGMFKVLSGEWRAADRLVRSVLADPKAPLDRRLALLDALGRGRAAADTIRGEAEFGHSAFGADWRGEKSASAPLLALVEWMRSLKGLGAEPRLVAGRGPDRSRLANLTRRIGDLTAAVEAPLRRLWNKLGAGRPFAFGEADGADRGALDAVHRAVARWSEADAAYAAVAARSEPDLALRLSALQDLQHDREALARLEEVGGLGRAAFGSAWRGPASDWPALRTAASWVGTNLDVHQLAARVGDRAALLHRAEAAATERAAFLDAMAVLLGNLQADASAAVTPGAAEAPRGELATALRAWRDDTESLYKWMQYRSRAERATTLGLGDIVSRLHRGELAAGEALAQFEMAYFEQAFASQVALDGELAQFDGDIHDRLVRTFVDLDRQRIRHAALEVVRAHHRRIPPKVGATLGPLRVLKSEIAKKKGHLPIRKLMEGAAPAVQALKPVFMMSPLSVAQFLPPGALNFDLLVMDEASQIQPVDALGAIARARQVVVVGDPKQLPPTAFFAKMTANDDGDDDDGGGASNIESILGLFTARGLPTRMLRWHYRSRHQSLIAVSNRQFYEDKLYIPPSPFTEQSGLGLRFHHVSDGVFLAGAKRTNPVEAERVARAIVEHAALHRGESLGVVAFSAAQKKAIQEALEVLRRDLPLEHEAFFQAHPSEPFFVKNLENVQGDERDVILISVGYGPTALGAKPPMRFGPVGQQGGERRLNVLISRAKRRCEVFASLTDEDIEPEFASAREGVFAFRLFLHFARTGRMTTAEAAARDRDEVFETQVAEALHAQGYVVHRRVGVSGIFIDVAVAHPERPDRYLLAVECDGGSYHDARSARDRDRLRRSVLEDHGWAVHRVWSTDWFKRPKQQLQKLVEAIEAARTDLAARSQAEEAKAAATTYSFRTVEREDVTELSLYAVEEASAGSEPYVEAKLTRPAHLACELHDAPTGALSALAEEVVSVEGPVHRDEIVSRIREAWGRKQAGSRMREAIIRALAISTRQHRILEDGAFYAVPGAPCRVRDRSTARSTTLRRPESLPPEEISKALRICVGRSFGATEEQAVQAVSRALGFKATSAQLRDVIAAVLERDVASGALQRRESLIDVGPHAPADHAAPPASPLETLIAGGETNRLEFKETLRWDIRLKKINRKLEDVAIKTIAAFTNMEGGVLLIGVQDDGTVVGLASDLACSGDSRDQFELHLTNLINARFGHAFKASKIRVSFPEAQGRAICRVDVQPSREAVFVSLADQSGAVAERLFVRSGNASHEIPPSQIPGFVREHFPTPAQPQR